MSDETWRIKPGRGMDYGVGAWHTDRSPFGMLALNRTHAGKYLMSHDTSPAYISRSKLNYYRAPKRDKNLAGSSKPGEAGKAWEGPGLRRGRSAFFFNFTDVPSKTSYWNNFLRHFSGTILPGTPKAEVMRTASNFMGQNDKG